MSQTSAVAFATLQNSQPLCLGADERETDLQKVRSLRCPLWVSSGHHGADGVGPLSANRGHSSDAGERLLQASQDITLHDSP